MDNIVMRIEKLENGYEVEVCDEKIMEENRKPKSMYQDPYKGYAFATAAEVTKFVGEHLDSLKPPPESGEEFSNAFKSASTEDD